MNVRLAAIVDGAMKTVSGMMPRRLMRHWCWVLYKDQQIADTWEFHIRPIHYYEPLPDFRAITPAELERRRVPPGIDFGLAAQLALLGTLAAESRLELDAIAGEHAFDFGNTWFSAIDACVYYALIRHLRPRRVIEIGSGYSTRIASLAVERNEAEGHPGSLTCIEPHPSPRLTQSSACFELIDKLVQDVPVATFEELSENDILMIDSSHVVKTGGDVFFEFLEILPRLKPGVWVHVHDIFFPRDYPVEWVVRERRAYNEQYILEAFLSGNRLFVPKLTNHWLALDHRKAVEALCPPDVMSGRSIEQLGSSFWMCRNL